MHRYSTVTNKAKEKMPVMKWQNDTPFLASHYFAFGLERVNLQDLPAIWSATVGPIRGFNPVLFASLACDHLEQVQSQTGRAIWQHVCYFCSVSDNKIHGQVSFHLKLWNKSLVFHLPEFNAVCHWEGARTVHWPSSQTEQPSILWEAMNLSEASLQIVYCLSDAF